MMFATLFHVHVIQSDLRVKTNLVFKQEHGPGSLYTERRRNNQQWTPFQTLLFISVTGGKLFESEQIALSISNSSMPYRPSFEPWADLKHSLFVTLNPNFYILSFLEGTTFFPEQKKISNLRFNSTQYHL